MNALDLIRITDSKETRRGITGHAVYLTPAQYQQLVLNPIRAGGTSPLFKKQSDGTWAFSNPDDPTRGPRDTPVLLVYTQFEYDCFIAWVLIRDPEKSCDLPEELAAA